VEILKILIVDDNPEVVSSLASYFGRKRDFQVVGTAGNSIEAMSLLEFLNPDVIILDLIMPISDGFCLLEHLKKRKLSKTPKVIILSCINHESIISRACSLGADYYIIKPYDIEILHNRIIEICGISTQEEISERTQALNDRISEIFNFFRIPDHTKGYKYLKECIGIAFNKPDVIKNLSKYLYPIIASRNDTNIYNVERSIRHAIELAWSAGEVKRDGEQSAGDKKKPSNRQFIIKILQQLNAEGFKNF
jgi:two-component system response regulator (stage 0 sporulation protein A)